MPEFETTLETTGANVVAAPMALARFRTLIETYGASPERWPEAAREAARALLDRSPEAREARADAAVLDRVLGAAAEPPAPSRELVRELHRRFDARRAGPWWFRLVGAVPSLSPLARPGLALAGVAAVLLVAVLLRDRAAPETNPAAPGPVFVGAPPAIAVADGAAIEDDEPFDLEIALLDRSLLDPADEEPVGEPVTLMGLAAADAPWLEDLPLD